jgi:hypothetical protein
MLQKSNTLELENGPWPFALSFGENRIDRRFLIKYKMGFI